MTFEGFPDRRKGLIMGIFGGLVGAYVMRRYMREVLPSLFPEGNDPNEESAKSDLLEQWSPFEVLYQPGENAYEAGGRLVYRALTGEIPDSTEQRHQLEDVARLGVGVFLGMTYGATRASTLPRDLAGGFFYGIRLWLGDEILLPLMGLRAGPTRFTRRQHFALLTTYWVYSFVTTNTTRLLYRLFSPEDW